MVTSNRQIKTGHNTEGMPITLQVLKDGKRYKTGQRIKVSKSEARRLLHEAPEMFKAILD